MFMNLCRDNLPTELLREAKQYGICDKQIGKLLNTSEDDARSARLKQGIAPWVKQVITGNFISLSSNSR